MKEIAIILFARNLYYGNLKTRIAAKLGNEKAMEIYSELLCITERIFLPIPHPVYIYWDPEIPIQKTNFLDPKFSHRVQHGNDLGERMKNAFREILIEYNHAIILGTDCPYVTEEHIYESINALKTHDYCIGPAIDGGYYLLGLKIFNGDWFEHIPWSTEKVFSITLSIAKKLGCVGYILPALSDIDDDRDYFLWKNIKN